MDDRQVLQLIARATPSRPFTLVGIGGRGGSGKTTLASAIPGAQVVSTDEFWDGEGFDLARLRREVVDVLLELRTARFASWDWVGRRAGPTHVVTPEGIVVIEGVCALHRMFRDEYDVRVWVEAPYEVRLARGVERDGEAMRSTWVDRWMPAEDRYVATDDPISCAHVIVDGSGTV